MNTVLNWFPAVLVLAVGAAAFAAVCAAICWAVFGDTLRQIEPRQRFWMLGGLVASPPLAAVLILVLAFYPSLLDIIGLVADHCGTHSGHSLHLCFIHYSPPSVSAPILWGCVGLVAIGGFHVSREIASTASSLRWVDRLVRLARFDGERGIYVVESDRLLALTAGLFRRRIVISDRIQQCLSPKQLAAVIAHERAHLRRFDGASLFFLRLAAGFHLPGIRRQMTEQLQLASEQCCDQAAASVNDDLTVAEAILAVERHRHQPLAVSGLEQFYTSDVEQRVQALLRNDWYRPHWIVIAAIAVTAVLVLSLNLHNFHHLIEHAFAWLV